MFVYHFNNMLLDLVSNKKQLLQSYWKTFICRKVGNKCDKIWGPSTSVKFPEFQCGVKPCQDTLLRWRENCCVLLILQLKRGTIPSRPLDFTCNTFLMWVCYSGPFTKQPKKLLILSGAQNKRRLCNKSRLLCKLPCSFSYVIHAIQWCLKCQWLIRVLFEYFARPLQMNHS